jgi:hypothetical protein
LAETGIGLLPLTATCALTVPLVTIVPDQLEAELFEVTLLVPSVNFHPE